jgi:hypothetical protein
MTEENDGILGNLPRSRPGVRSDKRAGAKRAGGAGGAAGSPPAPKTTPATKARVKSAASAAGSRKPKPRAAAAQPPPPPPPARKSDDPIGLAVKAAGQVAETGFKVASRMAGEVLRRLPRP